MYSTSTSSYTIPDRDLFLRAPGKEYELERVHDMPKHERPREKMLAAGPGSLTQAELVAVVWNTGDKKEDVLAKATRALHEYGEKAILHETDPKRLAKALGISELQACKLLAAVELGRRMYATRNTGEPVQVRTAEQAYHFFQAMGAQSKEHLHGLYLGSQYQVVYDEVISIGSLTSNVVHPREVFQPAISRGAVAVIIAHNHPSGSLEPSDADVEVTRQLVGAGKILGIDLLDHLIITANGYYSILEAL